MEEPPTKKQRLLGWEDGVAAAIEREIAMGPRELSFGVIAVVYPFWERSVTLGGRVSWIWAEASELLDDMVKARTDSIVLTGDTIPLAHLLKERPVEVILFEGPGPKALHPVWSQGSVTLVAWTLGTNRCGPPFRSDWVVSTHRVRHGDLGGSTSMVDHVHVAVRSSATSGRACFLLLSPVSVGPGKLARLVDGHNKGRTCLPPTAEEALELESLVSIQSRKDYRRLPAFASPTGFVRRPLTNREWLRGLDCPATLLKEATDAQSLEWANLLRTPFKTRSHLVMSIAKFFTEVASESSVAAGQRQLGEYDAECSDPEPQLTLLQPSPQVFYPRFDKEISAPFYQTEEAYMTLRMQHCSNFHSAAEAAVMTKLRIPEPLCRKLNSISEQARILLASDLVREQQGLMQNTLVDEATRNIKATKADDADVPVVIWNNKVLSGLILANVSDRDREVTLALNVLRRFLLMWWRRRVAQSFWRWWRLDKLYRSRKGLNPQIDALEPGLLAIHHAVDASWWDWDRGSAPFFWRFPSEWQLEMRDGVRPMFTGEPPKWRKAQRQTRDREVLRLKRGKIAKVQDRGYIAPFPGVLSLLYFFLVPKGEDDIRMVYDGTKSGLNAVLFAPWFCLPTVDTLSRSMGDEYWSADNDYGKMFLNFWLHPELRPYCGVDLTCTFGEELGSTQSTLWEAWSRNAMGLRPSPYASCQAGTRLKRLMLGDNQDSRNVFRWVKVVLNLPGSESYDPSKPWVFKAREDGSIAADIHKYVDDVRETAPTQIEAEEASSRVAKIACYFGCQDAARKKRSASQVPGSWAGANVEARITGVFKTVSQERWDKTKRLVKDLESWSRMDTMPRKDLERARGYLVYVALTFSILSPYLKGVHLSLESWRLNRDSQGWKIPRALADDGCTLSSVPDAVLGEKLGWTEMPDSQAPARVKPVPRLANDVQALLSFTEGEHPPRLRLRPVRGSAILFVYADASGVGFGSSVWLQGSKTVNIEEGVWSLLYSGKSSNFREMCNITLRLEGLVQQGDIPVGTEVFVFTDNQVTEHAFYRGTSSTPELFELVLRLKKLELSHNIFLRIVWVSGTRMIEQGTDGFSRGDLENGVATGKPMLSFVPLNLTPFLRSPTLEGWIRKSIPAESEWVTLDPSGWFGAGHLEGKFIWNVPPAAAQVALEQLCEAKLARPKASHLFICPALMTPMWRKRLGKIADFVFGMPPTIACLGSSNTVLPPNRDSKMCCVECGAVMPEFSGIVCANFGCTRGSSRCCNGSWHANCFRQTPDDNFPVLCATDLDDSVVASSEFQDSEDEYRFKEARNGDHFITPFQCDMCHFYNMRKRFPIDSECDRLLMNTVRRALLDSMWSRERSTVSKNLTELRLFLGNARLLGNETPFPPRGPFPTADIDGMEVACNLLLRSLRPGRNAKTVQFETMRKGRSVFSNYVHASYGGLGRVTIARGDQGGSVETASSTNSIWFGRFLSGCHRRMGDLWIPDRALTIDEVLAALSILEDDWQAHSSHPHLLLDVALTGALLVAGGGAGLRGEECPQMELGPLRKHWHEGEEHPRSPHVPLVLVGRFKQTEGLKLYFQPLAVKSKSGIEFKLWMQRVIGIWEMLGVTSGPVFRVTTAKSKSVQRASVADLDLLLHDVLKRVQLRMPNVLPASVNVENEYSARRSLRRFFTTQAQNVGIPKDVIEANNRWRKHMHSRGRLPTMQMIERYSDAKASVEILIRPSSLL